MSDYLPKKLLVNYLPDHVTDELLRCIFGKYGALIEEQTHTIPQNRPKGVPSQGYGFVEFVEEEAATQAMLTLNGLYMQDEGERHKRIRVTHARLSRPEIRGAKIIICNQPGYWDEDDIRRYFSKFGTIIQCRRLHSLNNNHGQPFAFVLFDKRQQAYHAIYHCMNFYGRDYLMGLHVTKA